MSAHSGARQWRHGCNCIPEDSAMENRMHSQVSKANAGYFISEDRLADDDVDEDDLLKLLEGADGSLIVCNLCGQLKEVDS